MFTNFTLNSEIARQRQSVLMARSARRRASRPSAPVVPETCGSLIELRAPRNSVTTSNSLVA
jgi:hypothetical protein